jgi:hypothetical protein
MEKKRYKVARGGRAGGKSYSFADAALARLLASKITIAVCRELDTTIRDSVHKLLKERIAYHKIDSLFDITDRGIKCVNGSEVVYKHLHNNVDEIKGLQGCSICWIFEAQSLTKESFDVLYPTIFRNKDAEIWIEFNPDNDDDFVMQRFIYHKDEDSIVVEINYLDNPLCPDELIEEALKCKRDFPDDYDHIWMGQPSKQGSKLYPMFNELVHIRPFDMDKLRDNTMFFMGQDPATSYYPFCVWIARIQRSDREFDYVVYNEYPTIGTMNGKMFHEVRTEKLCHLTLRQRSTMFRLLDNTIDRTYPHINVKHRAIDTRFAKASGAASTTLGGTKGLIMTMAEPENGGMNFATPPEALIDVQKENIKALMSFDTDLGLIYGVNEPHFFVMPHCGNVIDAFEHHRINKRTGSEDAKRKDPVDAVRIAMAMMEGIPHVSEMQKTKTQVVVNVLDAQKEMWLNNV